MAEESSSGEKKHAPTERRLRQAAERGDVHRSQELPRAAVITLTIIFALYLAVKLGDRFIDLFAASLSHAGTGDLALSKAMFSQAFDLFFPLFLLIAVISFLSSVVSGGWIFAVNLLLPDFSKIMPQSGLKQIFSGEGLIEHLKSILKFVVIGTVGGLAIFFMRPDFAVLAGVAVPQPSELFAKALHVLILICLALVVIGGADFGFKIWQHRQKLRMTDEDIRQEMKESVGNPHVKSRQRAMARRMARARQMQRIPEASVIVTNPTHYACAIRYQRGADKAPLLLAKGVGLMAEEIIARARGLGIPVVEFPPLARAVYRYVEPDEHIPIALYRACAEVLAYVWRLQRWRSQGGEKPKPPKPPSQDIKVGRAYDATE